MLGPRNRDKVLWVDALRLLAQVVKHMAIRDRADEQFVDRPVNGLDDTRLPNIPMLSRTAAVFPNPTHGVKVAIFLLPI